MRDLPRLDSPDQRFFICLQQIELRMSHWITRAALWDAAEGRAILALGEDLWSAERVAWSADSACVTATMRRYPGDAPTLQIAIYPGQRMVVIGPPVSATIPFDALDQALEAAYRQQTGGVR
jgi:hypothetical protein